MKIFAAAADYMSWAHLAGIKPGDTPITSYFDQNTFKLGNQRNEIKIPVEGTKVFVKLGLASIDYNNDLDGQLKYCCGDKYFTVYDEQGRLRVSLERFNGGDYLKCRWRIWNPDTGAVKTYGSLWTTKAFSNWRDVYFEITTTEVKYYVSSILVNTLDISGEAIAGFGYVGFGPQATYNGTGVKGSRILYMVIADTVEYSLKAFPYKPNSLTSDNEFVGTIDKLNSWIPDRTYMSSAAEYNVKCSFTLSVPANGYYLFDPEPDLATEKIIQMDQYVAARYVQSGGISANFKIHSTLAGGPVDYTLVCPANEDDTKSLIRKLPNTKTGDDLPNPKLGLIEISLEV